MDKCLQSRSIKGRTFRFNPAAFQGVLVKEADLENTLYRFELEDGSVVELKGNDEVEYDFDAPPPNPTTYLPMRDSLEKAMTAWASRAWAARA